MSERDQLSGVEVEEIESDDVLDIDPDQEVLSTSYEITSYGADYPVDGLVKRLDNEDIIVPSFDPRFEETDEIRGFQRRFVWSRPQMDRFIESLLLGLPVPGIFLVRDRENKLLVLDGQQRLKTLQAYYKGVFDGREYRLRQVQEPFAGLRYEDLDDEDRRRLDDSIIHATVLRQESPAGSQDAVYSIFERLNTGGSPLQPQEIRVALYNGPFLSLISDLNDDEDWRALYGPVSSRFKDQELILRVFALYETPDKYSRPLKGFLNHYLQANRNRSGGEATELASLFETATQVVHERIGNRAFRPVRPVNAAVVDSLMVGVMHRLDQGDIPEDAPVAAAYRSLLEEPAYVNAITSSTAAEETVSDRLRLATEAFQDV